MPPPPDPTGSLPTVKAPPLGHDEPQSTCGTAAGRDAGDCEAGWRRRGKCKRNACKRSESTRWQTSKSERSQTFWKVPPWQPFRIACGTKRREVLPPLQEPHLRRRFGVCGCGGVGEGRGGDIVSRAGVVIFMRAGGEGTLCGAPAGICVGIQMHGYSGRGVQGGGGWRRGGGAGNRSLHGLGLGCYCRGSREEVARGWV